MLRNVLIGLASLLVLVLLGILVREARSVRADYYLDYGSYVSQLKQSQRDYETLMDSFSEATQEARALPQSVRTLVDRLRSSGQTLATTPASIDTPAISAAAKSYEQELQVMLSAQDEFEQLQNRLANAVQILRDDSPQLVRDLRSGGHEILSQNLFGLTIEMLDFASGKSLLSADELSSRVSSMSAESKPARRLPRKFDELMRAADTTIELRSQAAAALATVRESAVAARLQSLFDTLASQNRVLTTRADRAQILLGAVCLLLLLVVGFVGYRLRQSYATLNASNVELEQFNIALERGVEDRTAQLKDAFDELKESQAQLVQAEKMSSLGELVAGISHEINTPLYYLLSNTSLIRERLQGFSEFVEQTSEMLDLLRKGNADKSEFLQRLRDLDSRLNQGGLRDDLQEGNELLRDSEEGLEQLSEMAQSLKDFSRLDRAAVAEINLNDGLEKTLLIAKNVLKGGVEVVKQLGELPLVSCSPSQINQVLLNLIKNASDSMDGSGTLTLRSFSDEDWVSVSVADTGCGITDEELTKIRDPFFTTKEVGKGTGLGLSISQKIVDSHGGRLDIESSVGQGSTFTLSLPRKTVSQDTDSSAIMQAFDVTLASDDPEQHDEFNVISLAR